MTLSNNPWYCADIIRAAKPNFTPRVAFILGSGLGALADQIDDAVSLSYETLPGFPVSTVHGHAGELVLGHLAGVPVACMKGRGHFYEGRGMAIMTDAIRTFKLLGCELLFSTNAAGSLRPDVQPGSLVALSDHINTMPGTPMVGLNDERFGERFFSLANAYDADYRAILQTVATKAGFPLHEGVFVSYPGPNFETAAEIRMMQIIGGDVVGMSVVPEVISARHCGLKVVAVSAITNLAEGLGDIKLSHEQTLAAAELSRQNFINLICGFLRHIA
ncbi:xanthosine phosphorylase [Enterobacter quasiroggenkampii]|uniref:Purine nucleoside phosphorylase n=1 Tax=Enterobacter cloacae complex sp. Mu1197 TaxID=3152302 RepID=A0AAU7FSD9_9ENTR|nr:MULTISPECIES: xanthosine phosphorylase [Enterobacter]EGS2003116.1 xanthosine phosphorylase [Enterobacter cloacae]MCM7169513.1 xanthosine phosphorylase [Enterobacter quasiroggenkampii]MCU6308010.1 xanthosine phosphorylase [Enterobacter quasiroggenkampii]MCU6325145.1 xanthosine phosphorylase [Enterobacter quasiroggenkampii]MCU6339278.1 xanthosine phosphorylase [Enterobacter quasiroggenkampii]